MHYVDQTAALSSVCHSAGPEIIRGKRFSSPGIIIIIILISIVRPSRNHSISDCCPMATYIRIQLGCCLSVTPWVTHFNQMILVSEWEQFMRWMVMCSAIASWTRLETR